MTKLVRDDNTVTDMDEWRRQRRPNLLGDPAETEFVLRLWAIANLIERPTQIYLAADHYGAVVDELRAQYNAPKGSAPPYLLMGKNPQLTVLNAGTNDEAEVNRKNHDTPGAIDFQDKMARLRTH
ncbi:MAG: hypothetical protein ACRDRB_04160 [Pseudonocardiaceae bacterium]